MTIVDRADAAGQVRRGEVEVFDSSGQSTNAEALRIAHQELGDLVAAID